MATTGLRGQSLTGELGSGCGSDAVHELLLRKRPEIQRQEALLNEAWRDYANAPKQKLQPPPFTLPIVFHIVHDNGPENISDADILRSLDFTNEAFANTGYYDQGTGTDTRIQFCLARQTPDNLPTSGITRTVSTLTDVTATDQDQALKNLNRFEPQNYINVWVVRSICGLGLGCSVAGYAYYPSAHGRAFDGIVVEAGTLTRGEAGVSTLIHELGHYLGLRHTFDGGCKNDDCMVDGDLVCDTPPDGSRVAVPCGGTANSCTTDTNSGFATDQNDMFINYMDYGFSSCRSAFTPGQSDRMHFFIDGRRRSLLASKACEDVCPNPVTANFNIPATSVEAGSNVLMNNLSTNATNFIWRIGFGGNVAATSTDFTRSWNHEGSFQVTLVANSADVRCSADSISQTINVVCSRQASYTGPTTLAVGDAATFTNTSDVGGQYRWRVNGSQFATTTDFNTSFTTTGLYQVCLEAEFEACIESFCTFVFVSQPPCTGPGCPGAGECEPTFSFVYGLEEDEQSNLTFNSVAVSDRGFYAGGQAFGLPIIAHFDNTGIPVWQTQLFPNGNQLTVTDLMIDQEGDVVGLVRNEASSPGLGVAHNSVVRLNQLDGNLRWGFTYEQSQPATTFTNLVQDEGANTNPYQIIGQAGRDVAGGVRMEGLHLRIDPATGTLIGQGRGFGINNQSTDFMRAVGDPLTDRTFVAASRRLAGVGGFRTQLIGLSPMGNQQFVQNIESGAELGSYLAVATGDGTVAVASQFSTATGGPEAHISLHNQSGNIRWLRSLPLPAQFEVHSLVATDMGYVFLAEGTGDRILLVHFDTAGDVIYAYLHNDVRLLGDQITNPLEARGNQVTLVANTSRTGGSFPTILRFREDGSLPIECENGGPIDLEMSLFERQTSLGNYQVNGIDFTFSQFFFEPFFLDVIDGTCLDTCATDTSTNEMDLEICDNQLDDDGDGFIDCDDPDLTNTCCCIPITPFQLPEDTVLCENETVLLGANGAGRTFRWSTGSTADSIFVSAPAVVWLEMTDSCGRTLSDTIALHLRPRPLPPDFGPDVSLCDNQVLPLSAPPGYASYLWVDGTTETTFTAWEPGLYWVEVTDSCGFTARDTIRITIDPTTQIVLGPDRTVCRGDTLRFDLTGFNNYQWNQDEPINCTDCNEVILIATRDTLLQVSAELGPGCISDDSLRISVQDPGPGMRIQAAICAGSNFPFDGQSFENAGTFVASMSLTCTAPDTLDLTILQPTFSQDTIRICAGDSALVFGQFVNTPGTFTDQSVGANGCDSLATIVVETEELEIQALTTAQFCRGATGPRSFGTGRIEVSASDSPVRFAWSTGDTTAVVDDLLPGIYQITVTSQNGCERVESLVIATGNLPPTSLLVQDETCAGDGNGSAVLTGQTAGLTLSLNGGPEQVAPEFDSLAAGEYTLVVATPGGCDTLYTFSISAGSRFAFDLGPNREINLGDSVTLAPMPPAPDSLNYRWRSTLGDSCTNCPTLTVRPTTTTTVSISGVEDSGCVTGDEVVILVNRDQLVYVPNAFSPNGDGVNETFRLYPGPAVASVESFQIYQRWGSLVWSATSTDPESPLSAWDGTMGDGKRLNAAVFVYQAQVRLFNGELVELVGDIVLMR